MGKILRYITVTLPVWLVICAFVSCNDTGCMENRSSIPYVTIYSDSTVPQPIYIDSLTVYGIGQVGDSMLLDTAMRVSSMFLPLRDNRDTTRFVIRYDQERINPRYKTDTLTLVYRSYVYFASAECGAMFNYIIDSLGYTTYQLQSAKLVRNEITNLSMENIQLFYHVN